MNRFAKHTLAIMGTVVGTVVAASAGFAGYLVLSYARIGDKALNVDAGASASSVYLNTTYSALTYNLGFGAYSQDFTFFLDSGYDEAGKPTIGHDSKAKSKEAVEFNLNGAITASSVQNPDFLLFQEVDTDSTRSHHINEDKQIQNAFSGYDHVHCVNFHAAFLPYPLYDMHGYVNAGLTTLSKYKVSAAERKSYTIASDFTKFFDSDSCFSVQKVAVSNGKSLYIVNSHMSAYDQGGTIRQKQLEDLNAFLAEKAKAGDYVVVGGDWNRDLLMFNPQFDYNDTAKKPFQDAYPGVKNKTPDWVVPFFDKAGKSSLQEGYKVAIADNYPSARNNDIAYDPQKSFVCTTDGFVVSSNVEIVSVTVIQTKNGNKGLNGFAFSDHEPVQLEFRLN